MHRIQQLTPLIIAALLLHAPLVGGTFEENGLSPAAVIISDHAYSTFHQVADAVERSGARGVSCFPPDVIFGFFPAGFGSDDLPGLDILIAESADDPAVETLGSIERGVIRALFDREKMLERGIPADAGPIDDRLLRVPPDVVEKTTYTGPLKGSPAELQGDRSIFQNSEFLIGTVLINIILPESSYGSENWTDDEIAAALSGVAAGNTEYQQYALWTNLRFVYNYQDFKRIPVSIEPIEGDWNYDPYWISQVLAYLGYDSEIDPWLQTHNFNNDTRRQFGTDWVFTAFIVDASVNDCWQGPSGGYVAYAYLGGPYLVVPFPACGYGEEIGFSKVFIHEMSHVFWALDEYPSAGVGCGVSSGYLDYANRNTEYFSCQPLVPCIMRSGLSESPLPICKYTLGQVGLGAVDYYWGAVPEIYNVAPEAVFNDEGGANLDTVFVMPYEVAIDVWNDAVPNQNSQQEEPRIDYAAQIRNGYYWVNGSIETEIDEPPDGWTSDNQLLLSLPGLEPGTSEVSFKFENSVGLTTQINKIVQYIGIKYFFTELQPSEGQIDVSWSTSGEVFQAVFDVLKEDVTARSGEVVIATVEEPVQASTTRRFYTFCDQGIEPAHQYRYRIIGRGGLLNQPVSSATMYETSFIPMGNDIVSYLLPNPTPGATSITVDVPSSYYDPAGGQENVTLPASMQSPALVEILTPVDIAVYNIKGQRIATVYKGTVFGSTRTFQWNGLDHYGRPVAPGVYFVRVQAGEKIATKKVVIVR